MKNRHNCGLISAILRPLLASQCAGDAVILQYAVVVKHRRPSSSKRLPAYARAQFRSVADHPAPQVSASLPMRLVIWRKAAYVPQHAVLRLVRDLASIQWQTPRDARDYAIVIRLLCAVCGQIHNAAPHSDTVATLSPVSSR